MPWAGLVRPVGAVDAESGVRKSGGPALVGTSQFSSDQVGAATPQRFLDISFLRFQRLLHIRNQVVRMLDTYRHAQCVVGDSGRLARFFRHRQMAHRIGVLDQ